jgi:hypothetical protein
MNRLIRRICPAGLKLVALVASDIGKGIENWSFFWATAGVWGNGALVCLGSGAGQTLVKLIV